MRGQGALTALRRVDGETGTARAYLQGATEVTLAGVAVVVDCDGALYWPDEGVLAIADLHLEKGSSFAARGVPLPAYDTAATLARLVLRVGRCVPRTVIALGEMGLFAWWRRIALRSSRSNAGAIGSGLPATTILIRPSG